MKHIPFKSILFLATIVFVGVGCSGTGNSNQQQDERSVAQESDGPEKTASGIEYEFAKHGTGEVPPDGGIWVMNIAYFDHNGTKMFSSEDQGGAMPMQYTSINLKKNSSIEECFGLIGKGDSAVFYISADSLYKNSYGNKAPEDLAGTKIKLCVGIEDVFSPEQFKSYNLEKAIVAAKTEKPKIEAYLKEKGLEASVSDEGVYYIITQEGSGNKPASGQTVKVNYTGKLLDGTIFDTSIEETAKSAGIYNANRKYAPIEFSLGQGRVILGWEIGIGLLPEGSKATLIIPSPLAYGKRGSGNTIKPNSILVFDVELVEIKK